MKSSSEGYDLDRVLEPAGSIMELACWRDCDNKMRFGTEEFGIDQVMTQGPRAELVESCFKEVEEVVQKVLPRISRRLPQAQIQPMEGSWSFIINYSVHLEMTNISGLGRTS